jgi:hypothetical protein
LPVVEATLVAPVAALVDVPFAGDVELSQPVVVRTLTPTGVQMFWAKPMVALRLSASRAHGAAGGSLAAKEGGLLTGLVRRVALLIDAAGEVVDPRRRRADAGDVVLAGAARLGEVDAAVLIDGLANGFRSWSSGNSQRTAQEGRPEVSTWAATEAARARDRVMKRIMDAVGTEIRVCFVEKSWWRRNGC